MLVNKNSQWYRLLLGTSTRLLQKIHKKQNYKVSLLGHKKKKMKSMHSKCLQKTNAECVLWKFARLTFFCIWKNCMFLLFEGSCCMLEMVILEISRSLLLIIKTLEMMLQRNDRHHHLNNNNNNQWDHQERQSSHLVSWCDTMRWNTSFHTV